VKISVADSLQAAQGIKEALLTGTADAVPQTGRKDGFFGDPAIKILMPETLRGSDYINHLKRRKQRARIRMEPPDYAASARIPACLSAASAPAASVSRERMIAAELSANLPPPRVRISALCRTLKARRSS
jgi:hypothetical protein